MEKEIPIPHTSKQGDLVYDVGMHRGEDTDFYLKKGFRVIGFEADPSLVAQCQSRFSDAIETGKLIIVEGAITELPSGETKDETIKFYRNKDKSFWGTVDPDWAQRNEFLGTSNEIVEVPVVDFSACLRIYGMPHYLKVDIEGMDAVCLKALLNFEQKPDYISIESEKVSFDKLVEELDLLTRLGYTKFKAVQQVGVSRQSEPNPAREGAYVGYKFNEGASGLFGADLSPEWKDYDQILKDYRIIFRQYRRFGDYGTLSKDLAGRLIRKALSVLLRKPIPGWYDTHAQHSSVVSNSS